MKRKTVANLLVFNLLILSISLMSYYADSELENNTVQMTPDQGDLVSLSWAPEHNDCVSRKNMLVINSMYSDSDDPNYNTPRFSYDDLVGMLASVDEYFYNVSYHNVCFEWHLFGMDADEDGLIDSPISIGLREENEGYQNHVNSAVNAFLAHEGVVGSDLDEPTQLCRDPVDDNPYYGAMIIVSSRNNFGATSYRYQPWTWLDHPAGEDDTYGPTCSPNFSVVSDGKFDADCLIETCSTVNLWEPRVWGTWTHEIFHQLGMQIGVGAAHQSGIGEITHDIGATNDNYPIEPNGLTRFQMGWWQGNSDVDLDAVGWSNQGLILTPADEAGSGGSEGSSGNYGLRPLQMHQPVHMLDFDPVIADGNGVPVTFSEAPDPNQPCTGGDDPITGLDQCKQLIVVPVSHDTWYFIEARPSIGFDSYRMSEPSEVPGDEERPLVTEKQIDEGVLIYQFTTRNDHPSWDSIDSSFAPISTIDSVPSTPTLNDAAFIPEAGRNTFEVIDGGFRLIVTVIDKHNDYYIVNIVFEKLLGGGIPADLTIPKELDCQDTSGLDNWEWGEGLASSLNLHHLASSSMDSAGFEEDGTQAWFGSWDWDSTLLKWKWNGVMVCSVLHLSSPPPMLNEPIDPDIQWRIWVDCNLNNDISENGEWLGEGVLSWDLPRYVYSSNGVGIPSSGTIHSYMGDGPCPKPAKNRVYVEVTNNGLSPISQQQLQVQVGYHKLGIGSPNPGEWFSEIVHIGEGTCPTDEQCMYDPAHYSSGENPEWRLLPGDSAVVWTEWEVEPGAPYLYDGLCCSTEQYLIGIHARVTPLVDEESFANNRWIVPDYVMSMQTSSPYPEMIHNFEVISPFDTEVDVEISVGGIPESWEWDLDWDVKSDLEPGTVYENVLRFKAPDSWPAGVYTDINLNGTFQVTIENDTHTVSALNQHFSAHSEMTTEVVAQISGLEIEEGEEFTISGTMDVPKSGHSGIELNGQDVLFLYESPSGEQFAERTPIRNGEVEDSFNPSVVTNDSVGIWTAYIIYLGDSNHSYSQAEIQFEVIPSDDRDTGEITPGFSIWTFIISLIFALAVVQRNRFSDLENGNTLGDNTD